MISSLRFITAFFLIASANAYISEIEIPRWFDVGEDTRLPITFTTYESPVEMYVFAFGGERDSLWF